MGKEEIRHLLPDAEIHLIKRTEDLIRIHQAWIQAGRPKPQKPTFFVISFTTMRGDSIKMMPLSYKQTPLSKNLRKRCKDIIRMATTVRIVVLSYVKNIFYHGSTGQW